MKYAYVVVEIVSDHDVTEVQKVFNSRECAEQYCEQSIEDHYKDIVESEHTMQLDTYIWTNGMEDWGYEIHTAPFKESEGHD